MSELLLLLSGLDVKGLLLLGLDVKGLLFGLDINGLLLLLGLDVKDI